MRRTADTVIVYVHWGTETQACPNPQQEPLAQQLVKAGADIVIGSGAHVLLGGGYLGGAYVDYGLGNFAFYDDTAPETDSGTLIITAQGRHITGAVWRPATILNGLPQPLPAPRPRRRSRAGTPRASCTDLSATPSTSLATMRGETVPFVAPAAPPTTTTTTAAGARPAGARRRPPAPASTGSTGSDRLGSTTTTTTTTPPASTTTSPTDNAAVAADRTVRPPRVRAARSSTRCGAARRRRPHREGAGSGTGSPPGRSAR